MKNILVLSRNESQLESIRNTCNSWDEDLSLISVHEETEAANIALNESADLVICDVSDRTRSEIEKLYKFTYSVPFVPCIALINSNIHKAEDLLKLGVSCCLETPFHPLDLY
jgi:DNA-binding NtrC family response regulator